MLFTVSVYVNGTHTLLSAVLTVRLQFLMPKMELLGKRKVHDIFEYTSTDEPIDYSLKSGTHHVASHEGGRNGQPHKVTHNLRASSTESPLLGNGETGNKFVESKRKLDSILCKRDISTVRYPTIMKRKINSKCSSLISSSSCSATDTDDDDIIKESFEIKREPIEKGHTFEDNTSTEIIQNVKHEESRLTLKSVEQHTNVNPVIKQSLRNQIIERRVKKGLSPINTYTAPRKQCEVNSDVIVISQSKVTVEVTFRYSCFMVVYLFYVSLIY